MLAWLEQFLVRYPELALFLVIAAGYWIGSFKIGAFSLGPVTDALFAGLLVGHFAQVPPWCLCARAGRRNGLIRLWQRKHPFRVSVLTH